MCDNIRYSRTGICIQCDAGLCKSYFHVTCAQKFGYLLDPAQAQLQVRLAFYFIYVSLLGEPCFYDSKNPNDPFIAYCKFHNDKAIINSRKASYLAMMSSYKAKHQNEHRLYEFGPDKVSI